MCEVEFCSDGKQRFLCVVTGAGLDKGSGYSETTSDSQCTQYTSADCQKY